MDEQFSQDAVSTSPRQELVRLLSLAVLRHHQRQQEKNGKVGVVDWTFTQNRACMSPPQTLETEANHDR